MKGAIIGDIIGSAYEFKNISTKDFPLFSDNSVFTDDTVMTCAVAKALMEPERKISVVFQEVARKYPGAGYGRKFYDWVFSDDPQPYNSCGNGSAMRVSPAGFMFNSRVDVVDAAQNVTVVTHNHPEGMKGAECTAYCIFLARCGFSMDDMKDEVKRFYTLDKTCDDYRRETAGMHGKEICQISVPQALECFFESTSFEDCMRNCISIGGDSDTIAAIAGGIAEAYYGVPDELWQEAEKRLDPYLLEIVNDFYGCLSLTDT